MGRRIFMALAKKPKRDKFYGSHELQSRKEEVKGGSNRSFGIVFAVVFALLAAHDAYKAGALWPYIAAASGVFALVTLVAPSLFTWPNRLWTKLGLLMSKVVSPLVMGALYYLVITPIGILMRLSGKDLLSLKWQPQAESYWIVRDPPGPAPESLRNQF